MLEITLEIKNYVERHLLCVYYILKKIQIKSHFYNDIISEGAQCCSVDI